MFILTRPPLSASSLIAASYRAVAHIPTPALVLCPPLLAASLYPQPLAAFLCPQPGLPLMILHLSHQSASQSWMSFLHCPSTHRLVVDTLALRSVLHYFLLHLFHHKQAVVVGIAIPLIDSLWRDGPEAFDVVHSMVLVQQGIGRYCFEVSDEVR